MLFQQKPLKRFMPTMTNNLFKKAACFTDIHWGLKNNAKQHNEDCLDFVDWFIEDAKKRDCETCIFLGDWHHNRSSLNISTMKYSLAGLRRLSAAFEKVYVILGNHDLFYRETRDVNSMEFIDDLPNIILVRDTLIEGDVGIVPWLVGDEWKKIPKIKTKYIFSHLELPTFKLNAMIEMPDHGGLKGSMFKNQDYVFTGHFHQRQVKDNSDGTEYVPCAFGKAGCNGYIHKVGCMILPPKQFGTQEYICPLCTNYLIAIGEDHKYRNSAYSMIEKACCEGSQTRYTVKISNNDSQDRIFTEYSL